MEYYIPAIKEILRQKTIYSLKPILYIPQIFLILHELNYEYLTR